MLSINRFHYTDIQPEGWVEKEYDKWLSEQSEPVGSYTADWKWDQLSRESQAWLPCKVEDLEDAIKSVIFNLEIGCFWRKSEYAITLYGNDWGPYRETLPVLRVKFDNAEKTEADTILSDEQAAKVMAAIEKAEADIDAREARKAAQEVYEEMMTEEPLEEAMEEY